jgi:hypothetical protein
MWGQYCFATNKLFPLVRGLLFRETASHAADTPQKSLEVE